MVQAAYSNNSSSVFQARFDRYLNDVLAAPMRTWEVNLGFSLGGADPRAGDRRRRCSRSRCRSTGVPVREPLVLVLAVGAASLVLFSSLGVVVGIYAETFDHHTFVNNIVILPLTFLGGVFYSVDRLPSPWHEISHANPIFYLVSAVRYGFLGTSRRRASASRWASPPRSPPARSPGARGCSPRAGASSPKKRVARPRAVPLAAACSRSTCPTCSRCCDPARAGARRRAARRDARTATCSPRSCSRSPR